MKMVKIADGVWLNKELVQAIKYVKKEDAWEEDTIGIWMSGDQAKEYWSFKDTPYMRKKIKELFGL